MHFCNRLSSDTESSTAPAWMSARRPAFLDMAGNSRTTPRRTGSAAHQGALRTSDGTSALLESGSDERYRPVGRIGTKSSAKAQTAGHGTVPALWTQLWACWGPLVVEAPAR